MEQKSPEWFEIRKWKMSASHAQAIGNVGKWLDTYITELMAETFSYGEKEIYTNSDMERWVELEEFARSMYELETGNIVEEVGFIEHNDYAGCSPDGMVWEDGMIEIKCVKDINHFKMILNGESEIESKYIWQMQMQLLISERKWVDYISYNPNYEKSLIIFRILPDEKKFESLKEGFAYGEKKIKEIRELLKKK